MTCGEGFLVTAKHKGLLRCMNICRGYGLRGFLSKLEFIGRTDSEDFGYIRHQRYRNQERRRMESFFFLMQFLEGGLLHLAG